MSRRNPSGRKAILPDGAVDALKQAVHRYNTVLIACDIGMQWGTHFGLDMDKRLNPSMGGHAITCCGYDRDGVFIQNSWGMAWANSDSSA